MFSITTISKLDDSNGGGSIILWHDNSSGAKLNKDQHEGDA